MSGKGDFESLEGTFQLNGIDGEYFKYYLLRHFIPVVCGKFHYSYYAHQKDNAYEGTIKAKDIFRASQYVIEIIRRKQLGLPAFQKHIPKVGDNAE